MSIESLQTYENGKEAKTRRKKYIDLIASLISGLVGLLLTWLILRVSPKDNGTLGKAIFIKEEKILEYFPKVEKVDNKLKKSVVAKPLKGVSKKVEEDTAREVLKGNLQAVVSAIRLYSGILIVIGGLVWVLLWVVFYYLTRGIISKFIGKELSLIEYNKYY